MTCKHRTLPVFILSTCLALLIVVSGCTSTEKSTETLNDRHLDTMTGEEVNRYGPTHLEDALQGAPGVRVEEASGGFRIHIRGRQTLRDNQPLYVIDGRPVNVAPSGLIGINPSDVESIRILKNANEIGMYGMRGANGVIEITTRRGGTSR